MSKERNQNNLRRLSIQKNNKCTTTRKECEEQKPWYICLIFYSRTLLYYPKKYEVDTTLNKVQYSWSAGFTRPYLASFIVRWLPLLLPEGKVFLPTLSLTGVWINRSKQNILPRQYIYYSCFCKIILILEI